MHLTSVDKLFLTAMTCVFGLSHRTGLLGQTRNSIPNYGCSKESWHASKQYGITRDSEELEWCARIAAGIYDDQGKLLAGLSISATDRLDEGWLPKLQATAHEISEPWAITATAEKLRSPDPSRPFAVANRSANAGLPAPNASTCGT